MTRFMLDDERFNPAWSTLLDSARGVEVRVDPSGGGFRFWIRIRKAFELVPSVLIEARKYSAGLFVAWAVSRNLLDPSRFVGYEALIADIRQRKVQGSALVEARLSRGLWDDHFLNRTGPDHADLWDRLWHYFKGSPRLDSDLMDLFGRREGEHGHDAPDLATDGWDAVDKASKVFDERFAAWVG
jgi:hypothetical protein